MMPHLSFFQHQLDYIFFVYGLSFLVLAAVALNLSRDNAKPLAWGWLALFGLTHGLNEFLDLLRLSRGAGDFLDAFRLLLLVSSFVFLLEFGRASLVALWGRGPGRWILVVFLGVAWAGGLAGSTASDIAARYALGLVGGGGAAWALLQAAKAQPGSNRALARAGWGMAFYALAAGLVVPRGPFFPAAFVNYESFAQALGFPIQLVRGLLALWIGAAIWMYFDESRAGQPEGLDGKTQTLYRQWFYLALAVLLLAGWAATDLVGSSAQALMRKNILIQAHMAAAAVNPERVRRLAGSPADLDNPDYQRLKQQLAAMRRWLGDAHHVHLLARPNGKVIRLVDADPAGTPSSPARGRGQPPDAAWPDILATGQAVLNDPLQSAGGAWVSILAAIRDPQTEQVMAVLEITVPAARWLEAEARHRLVPISITLVAATLIIGIFVASDLARRKLLAKQAARLHRYNTLIVNAAKEGIIGLDTQGRHTFVNPAAAAMLGYTVEELIGQNSHSTWHHTRADGSPYDKEECPIYAAYQDGQIHRVDDEVFWRKDGTSIPVEFTSTPIQEGDKLVGAVVTFRDILRRKAAEQELVERVRLATLSVQVGTHLTKKDALHLILQRCAILLVEYLDTALARIWTFNRAENMLELQASAGICTHLDGAHSRIPLGQGSLGGKICRVAQARQAYLTNQVIGDPEVRDQAWAKREKLVSFAGHPLIIEDQVIGVLAIFACHPLTESAIKVLGSIADNVALCIKEKWAEEALRESEKKYKQIIETTATGYVILNEQGRVADANPEYVRMTGRQRLDEILGRSVLEWTAPHDLERNDRDLRKCLAQGFIRNLEIDYLTPEGLVIPVEINATVLRTGGVVQILSLCRDISERKQAEAEAARDQAELAAIYDSAPFMMCLVNEQCEVERMNRALSQLAGASPASGAAHRLGDLLGCANALDEPRGCGFGSRCGTCPLRLALVETFQTGQPHRQVENTVFLVRKGKRQEVRISASMSLVRLLDTSKALVCLEDITERKQLEAQFVQAQKMEAIGQLAGGVAHDFNNILAATIMNLDLLQEAPNLDPETADVLKELEQGAHRAASLTRQLLLFSRRQVMETKRLDLNEVLAGLMKMLRRLLGEHIDINTPAGTEAMWVEADAGMMEQVVMNLCVNARDAMPKGGRLTLSIASVEVGVEEARRQSDARVGRFVRLSVADTGCGMNESTMNRIFEPFFTTKEVGKGTGLGLATVYGVVRQHQGWVEVQSAVGAGTTFQVYLPAAERAETVESRQEARHAPGGTETILLVEDDESVRQMLGLTLRRYGYRVLEARSGVEALQMWNLHGVQIALLFTDMVMPGGITGLELAERLRQLKPALKVVVTSGYSLDLLQAGANELARTRFVSKPVRPVTLARVVRACLDGKEYTP